jgi:hypothetical protein
MPLIYHSVSRFRKALAWRRYCDVDGTADCDPPPTFPDARRYRFLTLRPSTRSCNPRVVPVTWL